MSPVAIPHLSPRHSFSHPKPSPDVDRGQQIPRRPSPWHDLAHSLSELPSPIGSRRLSSPRMSPLAYPIPGGAGVPSPGAITPLDGGAISTEGIPALSSSQAMRDWERSTEFRRHQLIHTPPPRLSARPSSTSLSGVAGIPKLEPERDKDGHIEYKLKLIDPSPDRFERLVTQMLWRLKQGRNEAIYEIGLADDGAVIGLTRPEMDASLKTLEAMASEVGATVIVLREILLSGPRPPMRAFSMSGASTSSARSRSGSSTTSISDDALGQQNDATPKSVKKAKKNKAIAESRRRTVSSSSRASSASQSGSPHYRALSHKTSFDDSIPFQLDMDDAPYTPKSHSKRGTGSPSEAQPFTSEQSRKYTAKAARSAQRKEQRRLDLIRGDGTNPVWVEMSASLEPGVVSPVVPTAKPLPVSTLPAQPSSLRLTSTADSSPDDQFLADLWRLPLDSLSLSFADVCKVVDPAIGGTSLPSSESTDTEYAGPIGSAAAVGDDVTPTEGDEESGVEEILKDDVGERICVEALIVRKSGGDGWCGGEDDGWGFGGDDEDEEELLDSPVR